MRPLQAHCHRGLGTLYLKTGQQEQAQAELFTAVALYRLAARDRGGSGPGERMLKYSQAVWEVEKHRSGLQLATMPGHDGEKIARLAYTTCKNSGRSAVSLRLLPHATDSGQLALGGRTSHSYRRLWLG